MGTVKNILIISYAFPPSARSGIYRILHFSECLARRGNYRPFILTVASEHYEQEDALDKSLLKTINNNIVIFRTGCFQLRELFLNVFGGKLCKIADQKSSSFINDKTAREISTLGKWQKIKDAFTDELLSFPDRQVGWLPFAVKSGYNIIRQKKIDIIFSTGAPWTSLLIGRILSGLTSLPLVLDYRDPWIDNPFHRSGNSQIYNSFSRSLEKNLVKKASAVILNTDLLSCAFIKRYGKQYKFHVLHNGFLEEDLRTDAKVDFFVGKDDFIFIHTGNIYGNRSIDNFLVAFKECVQRRIFGQKLAKICLIGVDENFDRKCRLLLGESIFNECCILSERIPHDNCIAYLKKSQCFLIFQQDTTIQVPKKLFEYLALRKPILAITPKNGETARIIKNNDGGIVVSDKTENIINAIKDMVSNYKYHKNLLIKNEGYKQFGMKILTAKLEKILNSVIKK